MNSHRPISVVVGALVACAAAVAIVAGGCGGNGPAPAAADPYLAIALEPATGTAPLSVTMTATVGRLDGTPWTPSRMRVDWGAYNSQQTVNGMQETFTYRYALEGTYAVSCWAIDDRTGETVEAHGTVRVIGSSNNPPTCSLLAEPSTGDAPLRVDFTGTGADPDGGIVEWTLDFGDGTRPWSGTAAPTARGHIYTAAGTYNATLTVRDGGGATATAIETVTVSEAPATES